MAYPLNSPGVDVSVIDESVYATSGEGTVPLIIIGTHEYKIHPNGTDISEGTLPENANKLYLITSQRELVQTFGNPVFYQQGGTSRHGYELNEFGLHAAYQYLGMSNRAFIIRGAVDFAQLFPMASEPRGEPYAGTHWFDTTSSFFGIHEGVQSNLPSTAWKPKTPLIIDELREINYRIVGSQTYTNATDQATAVAGNLIINGVTVAIATVDTLLDVVSKISAANITGVSASVFQLAGKSSLTITSVVPGEEIEIGSASTSAVLSNLGLNGNERREWVPHSIIGTNGQFAIVVSNVAYNDVYQKVIPGGVLTTNDPLATATWLRVGSVEWKAARPTRITGGNLGNTQLPTLDGEVLSINVSNDPATQVDITLTGTTLTVNDVATEINNQLTASSSIVGTLVQAYVDSGSLVLVSATGTDIVLDSGSVAATVLGLNTAFGKVLRYAPHYQVPKRTDELGRQVITEGEVWINTTEYNNGAKWIVKIFNGTTGVWNTISAPLMATDAEANVLYGTTKPVGSLYVQYNVTGAASQLANHMIRIWNGAAWEELSYNYGPVSPTTMPEEGTRWFNDNFAVDIMVADGDQWLGYKNKLENLNTNPDGVILAGSVPLTQNDGTPLVDNDLWIDTSDVDNYPKLYRYQVATRTWVLIDNSDNSSPLGIVFADARAKADGTRNGSTDIADLLVSDYVDPDAPDPRLYPDGTLLFNTRYSTNNVKEWRPNYFTGEFDSSTDFTISGYNVGYSSFGPVAEAGRWVTISGNAVDGSPNMGRKAQRAVIIRALAATISENEDIRAESIFYNLIVSPGYTELIDEMVLLNTDRKETAFVIGDTPIRLKPNATAIQKWANPELSGAATNGDDGIITNNPYLGVYYPWGYSTNIDGYEIMIPPSTMALRTMAYNDSIAYQWMAPAGFTRGLVTNASNVGYLNDEGEFQSVLLNEGQRDTLYINKINPIAFVPNRGLVVFGQKTRHSISSALDRINVARLINYLRYNLDLIAKPFLFEPNDQHTRDSFKIAVDRFLSNLVGLRALDDFVTVCDLSNNTPDRIDRNELWLDAAIKPIKAVEFIYIPIRVVDQNTDLNTIFNVNLNTDLI